MLFRCANRVGRSDLRTGTAPISTSLNATFPLLVRYLKSQGVDPEYPKLLVAAVFFKDLCYFIEGVELVKALREMEGLNHEALHFRVLRWLTQTEPAVPAS